MEFSLPGHSADWVAREIAAPFERLFGKQAGLTSMKSVSSATRCLIELGYVGTPEPVPLLEVRSITESTWGALEFIIPEPLVAVRETQLA